MAFLTSTVRNALIILAIVLILTFLSKRAKLSGTRSNNEAVYKLKKLAKKAESMHEKSIKDPDPCMALVYSSYSTAYINAIKLFFDPETIKEKSNVNVDKIAKHALKTQESLHRALQERDII